jgi:hypothetical protein
MRKLLVYLLFLIFVFQLVNAAEVCVVVDYKGDKPDSKCVDIDEGEDGYKLMEETKWDLLWSPESAFGRMLCKINDEGTDISGQYCEYSGEFWNIVLNRNGEWLHMPVGLDAPGGCWNYNINSWEGHYCTKNGDVLGFAFGSEGSEPEMFKVNISDIYVDGEKLSDKKVRRGKIEEVFPDSEVKFKIELENMYDSETDIDVIDISIEGTIEEINDGSDIDEDISKFDLEADRKTTKELEFTIPRDVEAKDRLLKIEMKAEDDAGIRYEKEFTYDLEVEKEQNKLDITKAELNKDSYKCGENVLLYFSIVNLGAKNEKVNLEIANIDLGIDIKENFELSNDAFKASSKYEKRFSLWLPDVLQKGIYSIGITANYGGKKEIENIDLVVSGCGEEEVEEITVVEIDEISEKEGTEAEKEKKERAVIRGENLPLVFTAVLILLLVIIIALGVMYWVLRK